MTGDSSRDAAPASSEDTPAAGADTALAEGTSGGGRRPTRGSGATAGRRGGLGYSPCLYLVDEVTGETHPWGYTTGADPLEQGIESGDDLDQGW